MVTPWFGTEQLQDLVDRTQQTNVAYSKVATEVYDSDHPCKDAATDTDIFLFVIAIVMAGFGAVNGVLQAFHSCCHWWTIFCLGQKTTNTTKKPTYPVGCTYEMLFILLGTLLFIGLFVPLFIQTKTEFDIANYKKESLAFQIDYGTYVPNRKQVWAMAQPVVVTLVQAESSCHAARPGTLLFLLIAGLVLSVIANAPYIVRAWQAVKRWLDGSNNSMQINGLTVYSEELKVLTPAGASDFNPSSKPMKELVFPSSTQSESGSSNSAGGCQDGDARNREAAPTPVSSEADGGEQHTTVLNVRSHNEDGCNSISDLAEIRSSDNTADRTDALSSTMFSCGEIVCFSSAA